MRVRSGSTRLIQSCFYLITGHSSQLVKRQPTTYRQSLIHQLREIYKSENWTKGHSHGPGPKHRENFFINLALVEGAKISNDDKMKDKFLRNSLHGLVDDILSKKRLIELGDVFAYGKEASPKHVLFEGAPGIGKTRLACHMCTEWAMGNILQEYEIVLFVPLRQIQVDERELNMSNLFTPYLPEEDARQAVKELYMEGGKSILLILEGWDELAPELRSNNSLFSRIVSRESPLVNASVMVTSRPTVTGEVYNEFERRIEVLGFKREQISQYIQLYVPKKKHIIQRHLDNFPNIRALSHIPLALSIICMVADDQDSLPSTLTKLYDLYIRNHLLTGLKRQPSFQSQSCRGFHSLSDLPPHVKPIFLSLAKLAFRGMKHNRLTFKAKHLKQVGILQVLQSDTFDGYGLLSTFNCYTGSGYELHYQFQHFTIQEFLAAIYIKSLGRESHSSLLQSYRKNKLFLNIWKFFSGLTQLKDETMCKAIISSTRKGDNRDVLFLLHCIYETQNPSISQAAADFLGYEVSLSNCPLLPTDCLCLAYVISQAGGEWKLHLRGCNMGAGGLDIFHRYLVHEARKDPLYISVLE